jgi:hypothetical protein
MDRYQHAVTPEPSTLALGARSTQAYRKTMRGQEEKWGKEGLARGLLKLTKVLHS